MKDQPPTLSIGSRMLAPKEVAWIMSVGESTVAGWLDRGELAHFKEGRLIRVAPDALLDFILKRTRVERGYRRGAAGPAEHPAELSAGDWARIERLVDTTIQSKLELNGHLEAA